MYPVGRRGRAVGLLLAAGAFGAVGGPAMVEGAQRLTRGSSNGDPLVLPWFFVALLATIGLGCVLALRPDPRNLSIRDEVSPAGQRVRRSLRKLLALAPLRTAVVALVVSQAMMVLLMSVLPVRIHAHGGVELAVSGTMSLHLLGMFAFSPLIGTFIDRAGPRRGLSAGAFLVAAGAVLGSVLPSAVWSVATGLFLVGLGWSASFLGATAIISDVTTAIERAGALGFTDSTKGLASAVGGLCGGFVVDATGFAVLGSRLPL